MIPLFPSLMLDNTIHTAILIGLVFTWAMTERFGWVFAGFVVPGYLAAIGLVAPMSLVAVLLESVLTWGLAWLIGAGAARLGLWLRVFGRERFLLIILASIPVRLMVEGLVGPQMEALLGPWFDQPAWQGLRFFSIGVVIVPLTANSFWKLGLSRGLLQMASGTLFTFVVLKHVLVPLTNYQLGSFTDTFEELALQFLASPEIYVILVTSCFFGARNNLRYGWDFGGIIVVALFAILFPQPWKVAQTLLEAMVLALIYGWLLRLPGLRRWNLEGPRRLVSMYALAFSLKWILAWGAQLLHLRVHVSDFFGFGYLLSSIVALRLFRSRYWGRVLLPVLWTSGQGYVAGLLCVWGLGALDLGLRPEPPARPLASPEQSISRRVLSTWGLIRRQPDGGAGRSASPGPLVQALVQGDRPELRGWAERRGLELVWAGRRGQGPCLGLAERLPTEGLPEGAGAVWACGGAGPALVVPRPISDPEALWMAAWLAGELPLSWVVVEGEDHPALSPERRAERWSELRAALGDVPVLLLASRPEGRSRLVPRAGRALELLLPVVEPALGPAVDFRDPDGELGLWWGEMRPQDALLEASTAELASTVSGRPPAAPEGPPAGPAERLALAGLVLERTLASMERGAGPEGHLPWLGGRLGLELEEAESGLRLSLAGADWGELELRRGPASPWVVAVPDAAEEPGLVRIAAHIGEGLRPRALWRMGRAEGVGAGSALRAPGAPLLGQALVARALLRPPPGASPSPRLLLLRRQSGSEAAGAALIWSAGRLLPLGEAPRPPAELEASLAPWPGQVWDDGSGDTVALRSSGWFPVDYALHLDGELPWTLWFASGALEEVEGTLGQTALLDWFARQGVGPWEQGELAAAAVGVEPPEAWSSLRGLVEQRTELSLGRARRDWPGGLWIASDGLRLRVIGHRSGLWCSASAYGGPRPSPPTHGCWSAP